MHRELLISLSDLQAISIECPNCRSEIRVKITAAFVPGEGRIPPPLERCPVCTVKFDSTLRPSIESFREALNVLQEHSKISLQIQSEQ